MTDETERAVVALVAGLLASGQAFSDMGLEACCGTVARVLDKAGKDCPDVAAVIVRMLANSPKEAMH